MAAISGDFNFWNLSIEEAFGKAWLRVDNVKALSAALAIPALVMTPILVLGNSLVILAIWKDPLKNLRSSPSNYILLSMALADLIVGLILCPLTVYLAFAILRQKEHLFLPLSVSAFLTPLSIAHMFLLAVDRFFALVTPLRYRLKVTNKRVYIASIACWVYCALFGCLFRLLNEHYIIMGAILNLQMFFGLGFVLVMYTVTLCRFHSYTKSRTREMKEQSNEHRQKILQAEKNLSKAFLIVISTFLICFLPWLVVQIITYSCSSCQRNLSQLLLFYALSANLVHANSGVNPFLYAWRLPKYREAFKRLLKKQFRCYGHENRQELEHGVYDTRL